MKFILIFLWLCCCPSYGYSVIEVQSATDFSWVWLGVSALVFALLAGVAYLWQANRCLRRSQLKLNALWQHVPDVLTEVDAKGTICALNQGLSKELSVEKLIGSSSYDYLSEPDQKLFKRSLKAALSSGGESEYQLQIKLPSGIKYLNNHIVPLEYDGSEPRALVITTDISHHKEAQKILQQATKQAEESAVSKARFLANMSHEIRTPLTGIMGMVSLIEELAQGEELTQYVQSLTSSVQHLMNIVNDILDLSKSDAGHIELDESETSLWHILDDLEALYLPQALQKHIRLQVSFVSNVPRRVVVDAFRLRQVLYNLMSNAVKFTERGSINITVGTQKVGEKNLLKFSIKDSGIGIKPSKQSLIFDVFRQAQANISKNHGGTGLGLSICRNLVEMMGGVISVESDVGKGAEFWFTLPLKTIKDKGSLSKISEKGVYIAIENAHNNQWFQSFFHALNIPVHQYEESLTMPDKCLLVSDCVKSTQANWIWWLGADYDLDLVQGVHLIEPFRREALCNRLLDYEQQLLGRVADMARHDEGTFLGKLLLVEDNLTNQLVMRKTLEKMGYEVSIACNGLEGVQAYESGDYLGIIMDIQMPVMDGIEATVKIRRLGGRYVPIIALTANTQTEIEEACFAAGMDAFLTKPVNRLQLQNTLETVLGNEQQQRQSSA
mgnify:FL=1